MYYVSTKDLLEPQMQGFVGNNRPVKINWSNPITKGLKGYWTLTEDGGDICYDIAFGSNGTFQSAAKPTRVIDSTGKSIHCDDQQVKIPKTSHLNDLRLQDHTGMSISLLFKQVTDVSHYFICKRGNGSGDGYWQTGTDSAGDDIYLLVDGVVGSVSNGWTIDTATLTGVWKHIVFTYNGGLSHTGMKCYLNGLPLSETGVYNDATTLASDSGWDLGICGRGTDGTALADIYIKHVALYNRVLSQEEALSLYIDPFQFLEPL